MITIQMVAAFSTAQTHTNALTWSFEFSNCFTVKNLFEKLMKGEKGKKKHHKIYIEFMKSIHLFSHTHTNSFVFSSFLCVIYMLQVLIYVVCYACEFIFSSLFLNEYVVQFGKFLLHSFFIDFLFFSLNLKFERSQTGEKKRWSWKNGTKGFNWASEWEKLILLFDALFTCWKDTIHLMRKVNGNKQIEKFKSINEINKCNNNKNQTKRDEMEWKIWIKMQERARKQNEKNTPTKSISRRCVSTAHKVGNKN